MIEIEVTYATPDRQDLVQLRLPPDTSLRTAIEQSGLLVRHSEIDLAIHRVGVFGRFKALDDVLSDGDRVEIYRPLRADPNQARRLRVRKARKKA